MNIFEWVNWDFIYRTSNTDSKGINRKVLWLVLIFCRRWLVFVIFSGLAATRIVVLQNLNFYRLIGTAINQRLREREWEQSKMETDVIFYVVDFPPLGDTSIKYSPYAFWVSFEQPFFPRFWMLVYFVIKSFIFHYKVNRVCSTCSIFILILIADFQTRLWQLSKVIKSVYIKYNFTRWFWAYLFMQKIIIIFS